MRPEHVLAHPANVLTQSQRLFFFAEGYVALPGYLPESWLTRLRSAQAELIERSRKVTETDDTFILEQGHSAEKPRLHRVTGPQDEHPVFWELFNDPLITDLAADLVGPDVVFHHAKLNLKSSKSSRGFQWHQDIQTWPHTDFSPITIGIYPDGCDVDMGPVSFIRGSHMGPLYDQYDEDGNWAVRIRDRDLAWVTDEQIARPTGPAGTVVVINCRVIHGSEPNRTERDRPLLLSTFSSAVRVRKVTPI